MRGDVAVRAVRKSEVSLSGERAKKEQGDAAPVSPSR